MSTDGKVYSWGDYTAGQIGRTISKRSKESLAMKIEGIGAKNAVDIFCGNYHSFYINNKRQVFAFGMNNHGQLGLGHKENRSVPTRIKDLDEY